MAEYDSLTNPYENPDSMSGYVEALHDCPHVRQSIIQLTSQEKESINLAANCVDCSNTHENWFCLKCHTLHCGRFAVGHGLQHYQQTKSQTSNQSTNQTSVDTVSNKSDHQSNDSSTQQSDTQTSEINPSETDHSHAIAVGLEDLSFWCYACESYLHHLNNQNIYQMYATLHELKFGEPTVEVPEFMQSINQSNDRLLTSIDEDDDEKKDD